ncbi:hypothetical protein PV325_009500 [Microctonus aethiopoides]|nr:hypothetical protein PV325_009500 [Microctonus aethiopoides]
MTRQNKEFERCVSYFKMRKYEVEFLLQQQWYDPRLRYSNRSRYEFLNAIHHHNDIWLPDTYFIMHGDFKDPLIPVHFALRIYRNGTVNYLMRCLKVDLIFTRDRAFYFTTVFIPGIILVTSSFITFWLEWNAVPARVMIGVTTMLNFFTTSNGFRSTLPVVSNLTAMNVWDGVCMCFIYVSLLEFVCVNYVGRKRPLHNVVYRPGENPVTQGEKKREGGNTNGGGNGPNEIIACTNCGPNPCTHTATNGCAAEVRL